MAKAKRDSDIRKPVLITIEREAGIGERYRVVQMRGARCIDFEIGEMKVEAKIYSQLTAGELDALIAMMQADGVTPWADVTIKAARG